MQFVLAMRHAALQQALPQVDQAPESHLSALGADGRRELDVFGESNRLVHFFLHVDERAESLLERRLLVREIVVQVAIFELFRDNLQERATIAPHAIVQRPHHSHALDDGVRAHEFHLVVGLLAHLLQIVQVKNRRDGRELPRLVRRAHRHHEPPRAVEQNLVVHASIPRFKDIQHVFRVRQIHVTPERKHRHHQLSLRERRRFLRLPSHVHHRHPPHLSRPIPRRALVERPRRVVRLFVVLVLVVAPRAAREPSRVVPSPRVPPATLATSTRSRASRVSSARRAERRRARAVRARARRESR